MLNNAIEQVLNTLKDEIRSGRVTPTTRIDSLTLVCWKVVDQNGINYHQHFYDELPDDWKRGLLGKEKGFTWSTAKVIAVFDVWPTTNGPKDIEAK